MPFNLVVNQKIKNSYVTYVWDKYFQVLATYVLDEVDNYFTTGRNMIQNHTDYDL
jgi:hypothetical protein